MVESIHYIVCNPEVRFGKPSLIGTRITVGDILGWLASGMSVEEILEDFPSLTKEMIQAALAFAAKKQDVVKYVL
jgi:uncharacterized protein (DUF433 family)